MCETTKKHCVESCCPRKRVHQLGMLLSSSQTVYADCLGALLIGFKQVTLLTKKKNRNLLVAVFFLVREAGLEPARPE